MVAPADLRVLRGAQAPPRASRVVRSLAVLATRASLPAVRSIKRYELLIAEQVPGMEEEERGA